MIMFFFIEKIVFSNNFCRSFGIEKIVFSNIFCRSFGIEKIVFTLKNMSVQEVGLHLQIKPYDKPERYRRFNNSLIHFKDDYYLMTYRMFYPTAIHSSKFQLSSRKYHPWSSGWKSEIDETIVALLRLEKDKFVTLHEMRLQYPSSLQVFAGNLQDARIVKFDNKFYLYGQAWVEAGYNIAREIKRQAGNDANVTKCLKNRNCAAVVSLFEHIRFDLDENGLPNAVAVMRVDIPCVQRPEVNQIRHEMAVEKNWCFFEAQGQQWFQYMLHPNIVISKDCKKKYESPSPLQAIKDHFKCGMFFSPGGPLQPWKYGQLIGCGHMKYQYNCLDLLNVPKNKYLHPKDWGAYIYCLWFYTISDTPPFQILSFSHGYIPDYKTQHYSLVFPMACIELEKDKWAVSMGNGDDTSNVLTLRRKDIESRLIPVNQWSDPSAYSVSWWPVEKI